MPLQVAVKNISDELGSIIQLKVLSTIVALITMDGARRSERLQDSHPRVRWWLGMTPVHPEFVPGTGNVDNQARPAHSRAARRGSLKRLYPPFGVTAESLHRAKLTAEKPWSK